MKYPLIAAKIYDEPWLINPATLRKIQSQFESHVAGARGEATGMIPDSEGDDESPSLIGSIQVIPVHGILGKHLSQLEILCGGCSFDEISAQIEAAENDPRVDTILFDFRSPGGTVVGTPECANKIANCSKNTAAFSDTQCCSAALWLASCCEKFFVTESAVVGSCGCFAVYLDKTEQMAMGGIKANPISSGEFKLAGSSIKPMTDSERAMLQAQCDQMHAKFKGVVQSNRPSVEDSSLEGQCFLGDEAAQVGLVDGIVEDMDELIEMLQ